MAAPVIDTGYPKRIASFGSSYNAIQTYDSIRDDTGQFWIVGAMRTTGETYFRPYVWRFNSDLSYYNGEEITGAIFNLNDYHHVVSGITQQSDGSYHIVGTYHNGTNRHVWYSEKANPTASWSAPEQVDTGNPSGEQVNSYNINLTKIHANANDELLICWNGAGWDTRSPGTTCSVWRGRSANGLWRTITYHYSDTAGYGAGHLHIAASRVVGEEDKWYTFHSDGTPARKSWTKSKMDLGSGQTQRSELYEDILTYYKNYWANNALLCAPPADGNTYIFWQNDNLDTMRKVRGLAESGFSAYGSGKGRPVTVAFNETAALWVVYEEDEVQTSCTSQGIIGSIGDQGPTDLWTPFRYSTSPSRSFPVIDDLRVSIPTSGFLVFTSHQNPLIGDGYDDPAIYAWALDNLQWPSVPGYLGYYVNASGGMTFRGGEMKSV